MQHLTNILLSYTIDANCLTTLFLNLWGAATAVREQLVDMKYCAHSTNMSTKLISHNVTNSFADATQVLAYASLIHLVVVHSLCHCLNSVERISSPILMVKSCSFELKCVHNLCMWRPFTFAMSWRFSCMLFPKMSYVVGSTNDAAMCIAHIIGTFLKWLQSLCFTDLTKGIILLHSNLDRQHLLR